MNVISSSYGNDSIALIQWAHESGLSDVTVTYCDTGWAAEWWPARVALGEALAQSFGFQTHRVVSMGFAELARMRKGFPGNGLQWCTTHLKMVPFLSWIDEIDPWCAAKILIGKRREESPARAATPEFVTSEYYGDRMLWHPLFMHTEAERNALVAKTDMPLLPHRSLECNPCVNANREDFRRLTADEVGKVAALETEIGQPMFRAEPHGGANGIRAVIHWAKYSPGQFKEGQEDLFDLGCGSPFGCGL